MNTIVGLRFSFMLCKSFTKTKTIANLPKSKAVIVYRPFHQTDAGKGFSQANIYIGIAEANKLRLKAFKLWNLNLSNLNHSNVGNNIIIEHNSAIIDEKLPRYVYKFQGSNKKKSTAFITTRNIRDTKYHTIWGFIYKADFYETESNALASLRVAPFSIAPYLENKGIRFDSLTDRNHCTYKSTGKRGFYSLVENVNMAKYRVLLEVGFNKVNNEYLDDQVH